MTRNPQIGNTTVWVLPNIIWKLGIISDTKFSSNVSNEKLLSAANCQVCSFWVIKGKPRGRRGGGGGRNAFDPPRLALISPEVLDRAEAGIANPVDK